MRCVDGQHNESSLPDHKLDTRSLLSPPSHAGSPRKCAPRTRLRKPPPTNPHSHQGATERVEEFTPFGAGASSNRALPTPSRLSEHFPYYSVTWHKRHERCRQRTQYERSHTGTDYVVLRRRRSRLGAAMTLVCCGSLAAVHGLVPAKIALSASCPTSLHLLFFWLKSASSVSRACPDSSDRAWSDLVAVDLKTVEDCLIRLPIGFALQPARVVSYPAVVIDGRSIAPPDLGVCRIKWSKAARKGAVFLFNLVVSFAIGLCSRVTLCLYPPFGFSRDCRCHNAGFLSRFGHSCRNFGTVFSFSKNNFKHLSSLYNYYCLCFYFQFYSFSPQTLGDENKF